MLMTTSAFRVRFFRLLWTSSMQKTQAAIYALLPIFIFYGCSIVVPCKVVTFDWGRVFLYVFHTSACSDSHPWRVHACFIAWYQLLTDTEGSPRCLALFPRLVPYPSITGFFWTIRSACTVPAACASPGCFIR